MSDIGEILKEIEKNKIALKARTDFYYADRNSKKPVKCVIQKIELGYPATIISHKSPLILSFLLRIVFVNMPNNVPIKSRALLGKILHLFDIFRSCTFISIGIQGTVLESDGYLVST